MPDGALAAVLALMTLLGALASLLLKRAAGQPGGAPGVLRAWQLYAGGALYAACAVLNVLALRYLPYSVVLPLTALTYVWTLVLGRFVLKERLTPAKALGVTLILAGAALVAR